MKDYLPVQASAYDDDVGVRAMVAHRHVAQGPDVVWMLQEKDP